MAIVRRQEVEEALVIPGRHVEQLGEDLVVPARLLQPLADQRPQAPRAHDEEPVARLAEVFDLEAHAKTLDFGPQVLVIGDHQRDIHPQFAALGGTGDTPGELGDGRVRLTGWRSGAAGEGSG